MASIWKVKESRYIEEIDRLKQKGSNEVSTQKKSFKRNNCKTLEEVITKHEYFLKILSDKKEEQKVMQETISLYSL